MKPPTSPYQAIIFDLDGTVIDTEPLWNEANTELLRRHGHVYIAETMQPLIMGKHVIDGIKVFQELVGLAGDPHTLAQEKLGIVMELFKHEVKFVPGFRTFYDRVKPTYETAIATSMNRTALAAISLKLPLAELFGEHIYSVEDIGRISKPDPAIFLHAAKQLGVTPSACLVIEDAPNGVEAAHRAGMRVVALTTSTTRNHLVAADQIVDQYSEIKL